MKSIPFVANCIVKLLRSVCTGGIGQTPRCGLIMIPCESVRPNLQVKDVEFTNLPAIKSDNVPLLLPFDRYTWVIRGAGKIHIVLFLKK